MKKKAFARSLRRQLNDEEANKIKQNLLQESRKLQEEAKDLP
jgi:hypothetical protein